VSPTQIDTKFVTSIDYDEIGSFIRRFKKGSPTLLCRGEVRGHLKNFVN